MKLTVCFALPLLSFIIASRSLSAEAPAYQSRYYVLVDDPESFIADKYPYTVYVDLQRNLLVTLLNKPIDVPYVTSLYASKPISQAYIDSTEVFLRSFSSLQLSQVDAWIGHPIQKFVLPFENETLVGPNYKYLQLRFDRNATQLTLEHFRISTEMTMLEEKLHVLPDMSNSRLNFVPPVHAKYWTYQEQPVDRIETFSKCEKGSSKCASSKVTHSHIGIKLALTKMITTSWISNLWGSTSAKENENVTVLDKTNVKSGKQPLLQLEKLFIGSFEAVARQYKYHFDFPDNNQLSFDWWLLDGSKVEISNFSLKHEDPMAASGTLKMPKMLLENLKNNQVRIPLMWIPPLQAKLTVPSMMTYFLELEASALEPSRIERLQLESPKIGKFQCSIGELVLPSIYWLLDRETGNTHRFETSTRASLNGGSCTFQSRPNKQGKSTLMATISDFYMSQFPGLTFSMNKLVDVSPNQVKFGFRWLWIKEQSVSGIAVNVTPGDGYFWSIGSSKSAPMEFPNSFSTFIDRLAHLQVDMPISKLSFSWHNQLMFTLKNLRMKADMDQIGTTLMKQIAPGIAGVANVFRRVFQRRGTMGEETVENEPSDEVELWAIPNLEFSTTIETNNLPFAGNISVTSFKASAARGLEELTGHISLSYEYVIDIARAQFREMTTKLFERLPAGIGADYVNVQLLLDEVQPVGSAGRNNQILVLKCLGTVVAERKSKSTGFLNAIKKAFKIGRQPVQTKPVILAEFSTTVHLEPKIDPGKTRLLQESFLIRLYAHETIFEPKVTFLRNVDFKWRNYEKIVSFDNAIREFLIGTNDDKSAENLGQLGNTALLVQSLKLDQVKVQSAFFEVDDVLGRVKYNLVLKP